MSVTIVLHRHNSKQLCITDRTASFTNLATASNTGYLCLSCPANDTVDSLVEDALLGGGGGDGSGVGGGDAVRRD